LLILSILSIRVPSCPEHLPLVIHSLNATGMDVGLLINFARPKLEHERLYRGECVAF
jgi:hypothetical protein